MTTIEWTDETWNIVTGCAHAGSPGCDHCYARRLFPRVYAKSGREFADVKTHPHRLDQPLRWRKPRRIFACSMGDLFHEDVNPDFMAAVFGIAAECQHHTFQILTKRPDNMERFFRARLGQNEDMHTLCRHVASEITGKPLMPEYGDATPWPLPNVWLGASASTQGDLERVAPDLLRTPAAVRFLSLEPLLGPVDANGFLKTDQWYLHEEPMDGWANWVIVGCESGPKRRRCELDWVRSVVEQCEAAGVPCFVKQLDLDGRVSKDPSEWPEWARVRETP